MNKPFNLQDHQCFDDTNEGQIRDMAWSEIRMLDGSARQMIYVAEITETPKHEPYVVIIAMNGRRYTWWGEGKSGGIVSRQHHHPCSDPAQAERAETFFRCKGMQLPGRDHLKPILLPRRDAAEGAWRYEDIDKLALCALSRAGIATPAEGFVKAGWGWLESAIKELVKQRDEKGTELYITLAEVNRMNGLWSEVSKVAIEAGYDPTRGTVVEFIETLIEAARVSKEWLRERDEARAEAESLRRKLDEVLTRKQQTFSLRQGNQVFRMQSVTTDDAPEPEEAGRWQASTPNIQNIPLIRIALLPVEKARKDNYSLVIAKFGDGSYGPVSEDTVAKGGEYIDGWFPAVGRPIELLNQGATVTADPLAFINVAAAYASPGRTDSSKPNISGRPLDPRIRLRPVSEAKENSETPVIAKYTDGLIRHITEHDVWKGEGCIEGWAPREPNKPRKMPHFDDNASPTRLRWENEQDDTGFISLETDGLDVWVNDAHYNGTVSPEAAVDFARKILRVHEPDPDLVSVSWGTQHLSGGIVYIEPDGLRVAVSNERLGGRISIATAVHFAKSILRKYEP